MQCYSVMGPELTNLLKNITEMCAIYYQSQFVVTKNINSDHLIKVKLFELLYPRIIPFSFDK